MNARPWRRRWSSLLVVVTASAMLATFVPGASASTSSGDWQDTVAAVAGAEPDRTSRAYLQSALETLAPLAPDASWEGDRQRLEDGLDTAFVDGSRLVDDATSAAFYRSLDGLADGVQRDLGRGGSPDGPLARGLADALAAGQESASLTVDDAAAVLAQARAAQSSLTERRAQDRAAKYLDHAQRHLAHAHRHLVASKPASAVASQRLAWERAAQAMGFLGVTVTREGDRDEDGLVDLLELSLGSSSYASDSDGDGLGDAFEFEALFGYSMPASDDTDADGVLDGDEDLDGDGLSARAEQDAGTSPTEPDTDGDGIDDGAELTAGTDPLKADTDGDGLLDPSEVAAGTDARNPDTDGDGIPDGQDVTSQRTSGPDGVQAVLVGTGDLATSLSVVPVTDDQRVEIGVGGQLGQAYDFSLPPPLDGQLQQATLTLPFPADLRGADPADLRLFYLDEELGLWYPAADDQDVDVAAGTVTATVPHFSTYAIFDITNWAQTWSAQDDPCTPRTAPGGGGTGGTDVVFLDLAFVLDSSGSMSYNDPEGLRRTAAKIFVDALLPEDRAAVVDFDYYATVLQELTSDKDALKAAIDQVDDDGGTDIGAGVSAANEVLINGGDPARARIMILLTDGDGSYDLALTDAAKAAGITIYTIGLGAGVDNALLTSIAKGTGGTYTNVATAEELPEVFRRLSESTGGGVDVTTDTDGDGLTDCEETQGVLSGFQKRYTSDPTKPDTDDDGLSDADEVGSVISRAGIAVPGVPASLPLHNVLSDPRKVDSDGDGLVDPFELDLEISALRADDDGDGLADGLEVDLSTFPYDPDTDNDGFTDAFEHEHRADRGLDPLHVDVKVSKWTYAVDFAKGFVAGDLWREDSLAWLAGNLLSDATSFVPVVGWIAGAVVAVRDTIGSAIHADWVGAGLSLVGAVPYVGDAASMPGKVGKFLVRNRGKADDALAFLAKLPNIPKTVKLKASEVAFRTDYSTLKNAGASDDMLIGVHAGRGNLPRVAAAVRGANKTTKGSGFMKDGPAGERLLESTYNASKANKTAQIYYRTPRLGRGRYVDVLESSTPSVIHESKVGQVSFSKRIEQQVMKDNSLIQDPTVAVGGARWHFYASDVSKSIGPDQRVVALLKRYNIPYTIHFP